MEKMRHEQEVPVVEVDHQARVQAWPVHEPDWKREIIRCEPLADEM